MKSKYWRIGLGLLGAIILAMGIVGDAQSCSNWLQWTGKWNNAWKEWGPSIKVEGRTQTWPPAGCPSQVAVDVFIDGVGGATSWGYFNIYKSYQSGIRYGINTGRGVHFYNGLAWGHWAKSVDLGQPAPQCSDVDPSTGECRCTTGIWDYEHNQCVSPIIVHLKKGEPQQMTSIADGVMFDLDADGRLDQVSWTPPGNPQVAFLGIDRDDDGQTSIESGSELLGNATVPGAVNGFQALQRLNELTGGNADGQVDASDPIYSRLILWSDVNHNGISEPGEIQPASNVLEAIGLGYEDDDKQDKNGNLFKYKGWASFKSSENREAKLRDIYDIFLRR